MPFYLKNSNKIRLDGFGIFKLSFSSEGHEKEEDVSAQDIKNLRVLFTPSPELKKELSDISFTKNKNKRTIHYRRYENDLLKGILIIESYAE